MMASSKIWVLWIMAVAMPAGAAHARDVAPPAIEQQVTVYELVLRDGSRVYGMIERQDGDEVVVRTQSGAVVTARRADIETLREVTGTLGDRGEFMPPDPNATRLFFAPTGRSLKRGQTYLGVYEFMMPFVQVGLTDRLSIGGGTPLVFGIGEGDRPFWVTPKLQVLNTSATQLSVGVFHMFSPHEEGGGVAYAVSTSGGGRGSFTIGGGVAYGGTGSRSGVIMVGAERQVRRNLKLITENYLWKERNGVASAGLRFFGERLSADLALAIPLGTEEIFVFPVVNFVYMFSSGSRAK
jgi:hypothetical protein